MRNRRSRARTVFVSLLVAMAAVLIVHVTGLLGEADGENTGAEQLQSSPPVRLAPAKPGRRRPPRLAAATTDPVPAPADRPQPVTEPRRGDFEGNDE
jgi:hypothetical protein